MNYNMPLFQTPDVFQEHNIERITNRDKLNESIEHIKQLAQYIISLNIYEGRKVKKPIGARCEALIYKYLAIEKRLITQDEAAHELNMSAPTLRRHLSEQEESYTEISNRCRLNIALQLMKANISIDEISYQTGFSAPSGFSRAFKDWTGYPPSNYPMNRLR